MRSFLLHAVTPLHAGTGQAQDLIDLPIARTKGMNLPYVPGSSIKGVLRDAEYPGNLNKTRVFGPTPAEAQDPALAAAGKLIVGDARLLALPVRSFRGTFAWVTSPLLLQLAERDLGLKFAIPSVVPKAGAPTALVSSGNVNTHGNDTAKKIYLEDIDIHASEHASVAPWANWLAGKLYPTATSTLTSRFVVVDDETMTFLWETATQVDARISIDRDTGTVKKGALWLEESLPAESVLVGVLSTQLLKADEARTTLDTLMTLKDLQLGGKSTVGRGRCRLIAGGA